MGIDILSEGCHVYIHRSHLIQDTVLIARKRRQLNVATIDVIFITLHATTESSVHAQPLSTQRYDNIFEAKEVHNSYH